MRQASVRWPVALAVAALISGILGEGLLFFRAQAREAERLLSEDFKVLVFLREGVDEALASVVQERVVAMPETASSAYVTPEEALSRVEARDPTVFRSVAVIGENPLPGSLEVVLHERAVASVAEFADRIRAFDEVDEVVFKPLQARVLLQIRFYERFASMATTLAAAAASLWAAWAFAVFLRARRPLEAWREPLKGAGVSLAAAALGMGVCAWLAVPGSDGWISASVGWTGRLWLLCLAAAAGAALSLRGGDDGRKPSAGRERRRIAAIFAAATILLPSGGAFAASVRSKRQELQQVTQQLEEQKRAVDAKRREKEEAERLLRKFRGEQHGAASRVKKLEGSHREIDDERLRLDARLRSLKTASQGNQSQLAREVGEYRKTSNGCDGFYGSDSLWEEAFRRSAIRDKTLYLAQLRMRSSDAFGARNEAMVQSEKIQRKAMLERRRLRSAEQEIAQTRASVNRAAKDVVAAEKRLKSLEASARELANLIRELTERQARTGKKFGDAPTVAKGSLPWPVLGQVAQRFGKQRVPELATWTIHNGIEISARAGSEVRPVRSGTVIFLGPFRSYGNVIIINHGKGFYSIYGHLSELRPSKGQRVKTETVLASVEPGGGRIYLEFRQGGKAFDPVPFLTSGSVRKR